MFMGMIFILVAGGHHFARRIKMRSIILLICVAALSCISAKKNTLFNCKNPGNDCVTGSCNAEGLCGCDTGYTFENCGVKLAEVCTSLDCGDNGICVNDGTPRCQCSAGYSGSQCQISPFDCQCSTTSVTATITPPGDFRAGEGYVEAYSNVAACRSSPVTTGSPTQTITVPFTSSQCGNAQRRSISTDGSYTIERLFRFKYSSTLQTKNDISLLCTCVYNSTQNTIYSVIGNVNDDDLSNLRGIEVVQYIAPLSYIITYEGGNAITNATVLKIGDLVTIDFRLDTGYCGYIKTITADNKQTGSTRKMSDLLVNGCRTQPEGFSVMDQKPKYNSNYTVWSVSLDAFLFDESSTIGLSIDFEATTDFTKCVADAPTCSGSNRRKRDTASNTAADEKRGTIQQVFIIGDAEVLREQCEPRHAECKTSNQMMVGLIVMGSIICLLLIICFAIGLRLFIRRSPNTADVPLKYIK